MSGNREAFLTAVQGGIPDHVPCFFSHAQLNILPVSGDVPYGPMGTSGYDGYGCFQTATDSAGGMTTPDPGHPPAISDITNWKKEAVFPDYSAVEWEQMYGQVAAMLHLDRENFAQDFYCPTGIFERLHFNLGFEEAMIAILTEPEAVYEYVGAAADKKIEQIKQIGKYYKPDIFTYLDDYSHVSGLFISKESYRTIFKPHHKRIVDAVKEEGMIFKQHCCGKFEDLFDDFYDIGIRAFDPCQPVNDIVALKSRHPGEVGFMGGLNVQHVIDRAGVEEEEIRAEVRRAIDSYAPGGGYAVFGTSLDLYNPAAYAPDQRLGIVIDECARYGGGFYS